MARLDDAGEILSKIRELRAQQESSDRLPGVPNTVEASRYDDNWLTRFLELYENMVLPAANWELESDRLACPEVPLVEVQRQILEKTYTLRIALAKVVEAVVGAMDVQTPRCVSWMRGLLHGLRCGRARL